MCGLGTLHPLGILINSSTGVQTVQTTQEIQEQNPTARWMTVKIQTVITGPHSNTLTAPLHQVAGVILLLEEIPSPHSHPQPLGEVMVVVEAAVVVEVGEVVVGAAALVGPTIPLHQLHFFNPCNMWVICEICIKTRFV